MRQQKNGFKSHLNKRAMKDITIISLFALSLGFIGGFKAKGNIDSQTSKYIFKANVIADTSKADKFEIIRGSENGRDIVYSVIMPDSTAYDFLSLTELDSVLSGYRLNYND